MLLQDSVYFAYFPPYSYVRHQELIATTHAKKNVRLEIIGDTLDGHDLDVLRIGKSHKSTGEHVRMHVTKMTCWHTGLNCSIEATQGCAYLL